ncbi:hypothetical protein ZWY2020_058810 [Hordeum vulgare]|nr:hypothetical protein ZWY2020_058810 [Hordeum vulgare]
MSMAQKAGGNVIATEFHPTDEELISTTFATACSRTACPVPIIADLDIYNFDPWDLLGRKKEGAKIMDPEFLIVIYVEAHDTASKAHLRNTEQNPQLSTEDGISASTFPDYVAYESTDQMLPSSSIDLPTEDDEPERVNETEQCNIGERLSSSRKWEETAGRLEEPEENTRGGSDNHAPFVWLEAWPPFPFSILSRFPPRVTQHNGLLWRG